MSASQGSTVRRRRLGIELRRLREASDKTIEEVARHLERSASTISRIETGKTVPRLRDVRDMLDMYGAVDDQRELLLAMVRDAQQKGWWTDYEDVLPAGFETYVGLEAEAASLRTYQTNLVHGLLQTEDYARALLRAVRLMDSQENVDRLVSLRMRRQSALVRDHPLELWAVLDEAVLCRPIGGPTVMRAQLEHLVQVAGTPTVTIQILPFAKGAHVGLIGPFSIIEFPDVTDSDVVYAESPAGNLYVEKPKDVRRYTLVFDHLRAAALPPDESVALLVAAMKAIG
ncbi:helix-turn-helix transcriptional regulator [Sphaerisporangium sp. NPDC049002]|uniref:helix-turn-helix domain-containing protein n=1 Tax=Sphaerisporangium sp. NPDC049002 TaxID=3155392 RepID=UPI0033E57EBD